ncbi:DUF308 domain-containing protein [Streptomyces sp. NPDC028635]|uniref:HdeD family acid-resistance protein n=1 Tax=Streptomyces sp. NPDC028635 TaxID=3154800 RepID=UPI0033D14CCD
MTVSRAPAPPTGSEPPPEGAEAARGGGPARPADATDAELDARLAQLGGSWTWLLGSAATTLIPGILVLVWPDETLHVLAVLIGLYLIATGVFRLVAAFAREYGDRHTGLLIAVLYVLAGVLCLRHPLQTIAALALITGALWLVTGLLTAWAALAAKGLPHRGYLLGVAALAVVAGVVVLALPSESAVALTRLLGLWLVLLGVAELGLALALRASLRKNRSVTPSGPPPA